MYGWSRNQTFQAVCGPLSFVVRRRRAPAVGDLHLHYRGTRVVPPDPALVSHGGGSLRDHVAALPYDDGTGPFGEELEWLLRVSGGTEPVEMLPVGHCRGTWLWSDGERYEPQYITYVVCTDVTTTT